jgi:hypothetical protein
VKVIRTAVDELLDEFRNVRAGGPFCREFANLLFTWDLAGKEEPEDTFRKRFLTTGSFWKGFLAFRDLRESIQLLEDAELLLHTVKPRKRIPSSASSTEPCVTPG